MQIQICDNIILIFIFIQNKLSWCLNLGCKLVNYLIAGLHKVEK